MGRVRSSPASTTFWRMLNATVTHWIGRLKNVPRVNQLHNKQMFFFSFLFDWGEGCVCVWIYCCRIMLANIILMIRHVHFLEFMNYNRLQQDHPCVINYIRRHYLKGPSPSDVPLNLDYPEVRDPSDGQPNTILDLLHNKVSHTNCSINYCYASVMFYKREQRQLCIGYFY